MRNATSSLVLSLVVGWPVWALAGSWPQFRGPDGSAVADGTHAFPTQIGPNQNVVWKTPLPPGHSSPVIYGNRIYLTGVQEKRLVTLGIDRGTGKILWESEAPYTRLEKIHQIGSRAQSTPVTDGTRVVSFFGSCGLLCYDANGKLLWHLPMGPFKSDFGAGSSPIIVGDKVILSQDHDRDSFLMAIDKHTGKIAWKTDRSEFPVGYASPVIWNVADKKQIVVAGTLRIVGYDLETGKEIWTLRGMARVMNMTPSIGPDNILYVAGWAAAADAGERFPVPPFSEMLAQRDANKNGTLEIEELPEGGLKQRFSLIDRDKDGHITRAEYEDMRHIFLTAQNRMVALKPGGRGEISDSQVLWMHAKHLPFVPSPLLYRGLFFLVKNGGIVTALDARTGKPAKQERVRGTSDYYSSPVGGDDKVYLCSQRGHVMVLSAEAQWHVLSSSHFDEDIYATPALVDGQIYLRTTGYLYCFGAR